MSEPPPAELPAQPIALAPGFELPTARQVVGRGLQLAYDSTRDLRGASVYIGLVVLAVIGPFAALLLADIPKVAGIPFDAPDTISREQATRLLEVIGPLYAAGVLALLGFLSISIDSTLMAVAILAGRAVGHPLSLREALGRARQVYWRYGFAAFIVGVLSIGISAAIQAANGSLGRQASLGVSLGASFVATLVVLPFSYVATATVIGDVNGAAALSRSITLVRARGRLALAVAAFAFAASALQTLGLGAAVGVVQEVADILHPSLELSGGGLVLAGLLAALGLVALGSLIFTVAAVTTAPQVAAFLGLTHFSAGLDRARTPASPPPAREPATASEVPPDPAHEASAGPSTYWDQAPVAAARQPRWVTIPMIGLVVLEALVVLLGLVSGPPA